MLQSIFKSELWTKPLASWYLYDFANSFVFINATLYFSQWVVVDNKFSDFWLSVPFILGTAILVFLSPYIGNFGDKYGAHYRIFFWTTLGTAVSALLMFGSGRLGLSSSQAVIFALIFYGLYQFFYQLAFVPYGVFMKYLSPANDYGKVSGIGLGVSEIGHLSGIFLTIPIVYGMVTIFGTDHLAPLFPAAIAFFVFSLPALLVLKSKGFAFNRPSKMDFEKPSLLKSLWSNLREARNYPGVLHLILSFYLFSDAIISVTFFSAIYLQNVFGAGDAFIIKSAVLVILGFAIGAVASGWLADKSGHKKILLWSLAGNALIMIAIGLIQGVSWNLLLFAFFGIFNGGAYTSSRSYLASLIPEEFSGKFFGLYAFAERFASIIGPVLWSLTTWLFVSYFPANYRIAVLVMASLVILSILPLAVKVKKA
jgi:UMF1 family MFS transporter